jgi:hypothetical protein
MSERDDCPAGAPRRVETGTSACAGAVLSVSRVA